MTTAWYYDYFEEGTFPNQKALCAAVRWTKCNLEGQRLVSPTHLTAPIGNPLTIRLFALQQALTQLESTINTINSQIMQRARENFDKGESFSMGGSFETQNSSAQTKGAPVEIIELAGQKEYIEFQHATVHISLYEIFINLGSVLDRLSYEINMLYELGINRSRVDWGQLTEKTNLAKLERKDNYLAGLLEKCAVKFKKALRYRNRLIHDGIIRVNVDIGLLSNKGINWLSVKLAKNPDKDESPLNVDALEFCNNAKKDVLDLANESYKLMFLYIERLKEALKCQKQK